MNKLKKEDLTNENFNDQQLISAIRKRKKLIRIYKAWANEAKDFFAKKTNKGEGVKDFLKAVIAKLFQLVKCKLFQLNISFKDFILAICKTVWILEFKGLYLIEKQKQFREKFASNKAEINLKKNQSLLLWSCLEDLSLRHQLALHLHFDKVPATITKLLLDCKSVSATNVMVFTAKRRLKDLMLVHPLYIEFKNF